MVATAPLCFRRFQTIPTTNRQVTSYDLSLDPYVTRTYRKLRVDYSQKLLLHAGSVTDALSVDLQANRLGTVVTMSSLGPGLPEFTPRKELKIFDIFRCRDGTDSLPTVFRYTCYGAVTGAFVSAYDIMGYTSPSTFSGAMAVCYKHIVPMAAVGGIYSAVTCISANVRHKNDQYNHFFAGLAAGSVYGFKLNNQKVGWGLGMALGITGMLLKRAYMENWELAPKYFYREKGFTHYRDSYLTSRPHPEGRDDLKA